MKDYVDPRGIRWTNIRPIGVFGNDYRAVPGINPIPQEDRKDFVKFTPAKIEKPK